MACLKWKIEKIEAKKKKKSSILWSALAVKLNNKKKYCNQQSGPCRFTVCQCLLFFLLQLTRNLTVNNDDDSAMTYIILGTHLCHALTLKKPYRSKFQTRTVYNDFWSGIHLPWVYDNVWPRIHIPSVYDDVWPRIRLPSVYDDFWLRIRLPSVYDDFWLRIRLPSVYDDLWWSIRLPSVYKLNNSWIEL